MTDFMFFSDRIRILREDRNRRSELIDSVVAFMSGVAALVNDAELYASIDRFWTEPEISIKMRGSYLYGCEGARTLELDSAHAGPLIVPRLVQINFDVTSATAAEMSYRFVGDEEGFAEGTATPEFTLALTNPRDIVGAKWEASIGIHASDEADSIDVATLPPQNVEIRESNLMFRDVSFAVQESIASARFTPIQQ